MNLFTNNYGEIILERGGTKLQVSNTGFRQTGRPGARIIRMFNVLAVLALGPRQNYQVGDQIGVLMRRADAQKNNVSWSANFPYDTTDTPIVNFTRGYTFRGDGQSGPYTGGDSDIAGLQGPFSTGLVGDLDRADGPMTANAQNTNA